MADLVLDTDVTSLMWRDALPWQIDRQLLERKAAMTFVTLGEALAGAYGAGWTHQRRDGLRAFYEHTFGSLG